MIRRAITPAALLAVVLATQLLPASTTDARGTPLPILFEGLVLGCVNALTAAGIVLVYRTTRVLNFAQAAIGAGGAVLCFNLMQLTPVPFWADVPLGVLLAAVLGASFDLVFGRRFARSPRVVLTVLTIVAAGFLSTTGRSVVDGLPFFPDRAQRTLEQLGGDASLRPLMPLSGFSFTLPGLPLAFGFAELFALGCAFAAMAGVGAFLRYTRAGVAVRATAESTERAALLGISVGMLSTLVWTIAGALSGLGSILTGVVQTPAATSGVAPDLLLPAFAAAVLARMRSFPVALAASAGIAVAGRALRFRQPELEPLLAAGLLVVIAAGLLAQRRGRSGRGDAVASAWTAVDELRPMPDAMRRLAAVRLARWGLVAAAIAGIALWPFVTSAGYTYLGGVIALHAIVGLSLVVLTGWTGQVSLGQFALAAVGGVTAAALIGRTGVSFWIAVPAASVVAAGVAALVGVPALRIPGLFLGVATFALAVAVRQTLFSERLFGWLLPAGGVDRPRLLIVDFEDERSMYFLCVAALALACGVVANLRRTRFGRVVIAVRENAANAQTAGVSETRTKLAAFAVSGLLAGFAGALLAVQQRGMTADSYGADASIDIFVLAVLGGAGSIWGPLLGSAYLNGVRFGLSGFPELAAALGPGLALYMLYAFPGGLLSVVVRARDAWLRMLAQRHGIVTAGDARTVPIGPPVRGAGLETVANRYRIATSIYARRGVRDA